MDPGGDLETQRKLPAPNETEEWPLLPSKSAISTQISFNFLGSFISWALVFLVSLLECLEVGRSPSVTFDTTSGNKKGPSAFLRGQWAQRSRFASP